VVFCREQCRDALVLSKLDRGILLLPEAIVADELANGSLPRVFPLWQGTPELIYALTGARLLPAKIQ